MHLLAIGISFQQAEGWIAAVGYPALFGLLFACGLGLPLPEDIPLVISGALIARGQMVWPIAAVCAWCGIIGGDICLYTIGRKLGPAVTRLRMLRGHITEARLKRVEKLYDEYGVGVIAVGRLFAGIRGAMVICAGTIRFNFLTFIIADGLAAIVSGGLWMCLGHWLGANLNEEVIGHYKNRIIIGMIVIAVGFLIWVLWRRRHREAVIAHDVRIVQKVGEMKEKVVEKIQATVSSPVTSQVASPLTPSAQTPNLEAGNESHPNKKEISMPLEAKPLAFPSDALEPNIDKQTMEIHHGKHYAAYVNNYNKAVSEKQPDLEGKPLHEVLANNCAMVKDEIKTAVRNNGGGAHNHALFWEIINPAGKPGTQPVGKLADAIKSTFGSFDAFKEKFAAAATTRFGSGWAWLIKKGDKIEVISTANQDSPIMEGAFPIIGLDVWEHAYYLKYQNRRPDYITAWWNVINWKIAGERFDRAK
jgi:Fe-Mn family superoxide dismutase